MKTLIRHLFGKIKEAFLTFFSWFKPGPVALKGAATGTLVIFLLFIMVAAVHGIRETTLSVALLQIAYQVGLPMLVALGVSLVLAILVRIPKAYRTMLFACIFFVMYFFYCTVKGKLFITAWILLFSSLAMGSLWAIWKGAWKELKLPSKIILLLSLLIGTGGLTAGGAWLYSQGKKTDPPVNAAMMCDSLPSVLDLPDPGLPGEETILTLTYGSGKDKHRKEYGDSADLITLPVDGRPFLSNWKKISGWLRTKYWGFGPDSLPLNARVWYPQGKGPYPLVLVVHGNHHDRDYSDPGYDYLGKLLAARGFILASVDENFVNAAWYDLFGQLKEENDARGWLLLKHLQCWKEWNQTLGNPFYNKVDMERLALVGHSRGGEAVSIAPCFNQLPYYPDDATIPFDFGFYIKAVIAIAPVDGQYKPAKTGTFFANVSYFVLQGSHDMDMRSYHGARQMHRIRFTDGQPHVKAGLYIYGANHGQFNTSWGRNDMGYPGIYLFNRKEIMPVDEQEKIARVYISAFLEMVLHDRWDYRPLFRDARRGRSWLPSTVYLNQYLDSETSVLCSFDEDIDLTTTSIAGGRILSSDLTVWREQEVPLKWGEYDTRAVYLGWNREASDTSIGCYTISFPRCQGGKDASLVFSLADAGEDSNPVKDWIKKDTTGTREKADTAVVNKEKRSKEKEKKEPPVDFTICLTDSLGQEANLPLSHFAPLQPQLKAKVVKLDFMTDVPEGEIVFQDYLFPLVDFVKTNPSFNPAGIIKIMFRFDRSDKGVVVLDDLGIRPTH